MKESLSQSEIEETRSECSDDAADSESPAKSGNTVRIFNRIAGATALGALAYAFVIRPWHLHWGATEEEAAQALPGDELLPQVRMQTTRAITVKAPAAAIWPWLMQMGQGRGGLYSYDWLENLFGCDIHSAESILPDLGQLQVGDRFLLGPEGSPFFTVASITPERALVLSAGPETGDGTEPGAPSVAGEYMPVATWTFVLRPIDDKSTRLLVRLRGNWDHTVGMTLFNHVLLEPAHFVMERKMIYGIKERAERSVAGT